ncbi:unnamed protein product [Eruca vesicaria subsp. sativa]|uniref:Uncharacterized protein n=1 Tax=Eruca vesicaria subsp. sativa TaxID=29727 RepID=A0ABC8JHM7_ERUVS|nr:unnamed protein product [Eruca vesicaria subsp. sativa]
MSLSKNDMLETTTKLMIKEKSKSIAEGSGEYVPAAPEAVFSMGHDNQASSGMSGKSKSSKRKGASWKRFKQNTGAGTATNIENGKNRQENEDNKIKRKSSEEAENIVAALCIFSFHFLVSQG